MASGLTPIYFIPYPLSTDPVDVHGDIQDLALQLENVLLIKADKNISNTFTQQNVFSVNSTSDAIRINQGGSGNALLVEDSANPDSTPFVIDATGRVGVGKTTPAVLFDVAGVGAFSGALTASTFNALTLTAAATGFTIAGGTTSKTLTISNTLTLAGTDATTMTFPSTSQSIAGLTATQLFTNKSLSDSTTFIVDVTDNTKRLQFDVTGTTNITGIFQTAFTTAKTVSFQDVAGTVYVSSGTDVTLADGGTNASLTASNGGIVYSTATAMAILAGTATAGQMLRSGATGAPSWSTATFPATTTINQILFSSAANVVTGLATANNQVLVTGATGIPAFSGTLPSGVTASSLTSFGTSPTLITPNIGVATGTSFNSITGLASTTPVTFSGTGVVGTGVTVARADHAHPLPATLTIGTGLSGTSYNGSSAVTIANTGVLSVNGSTGAVIGIATTAGTLAQFAATTSAQLSGVISDETGSGALVFATSPTLVTPVLGVATGTSFNSITGLSSTTPLVDGTAAVGTATTTARADHVHPTPTSVVATVSGTNSADLVYGNMADSDQFRIRIGGTATNVGFVEIATADDGTEPIHVRQYTGVFTTLARTATLLDGSGNTIFPGTVSATSFNSITGLSAVVGTNLGTAAVGTATTTARADHVHPTTGLGLTGSGLNQFAATTSAQLAGVISDETGSGALVFATSPTLVTPVLGVATGTSLTLSGALIAATKSFDIQHPTKPDMRLRYGSLEGPENGVYIRGKSKDKTIELPDYWTGLVHQDSITVSLTSIGSGTLYVKEIIGNTVFVGGTAEEFFFTVFGERKDVDKLLVEY